VRAPILFISDRPERFAALRRSALGGRELHLWVREQDAPPRNARHVRGDPTRPETFAALGDEEDLLVVVDLAGEQRAGRVARAARGALPRALVLVIARERGRRHGSTRAGITWIDEGELLSDAIELVLRRARARRSVMELRRALGGARRCAFLVQHDPDPDAIASSLALRAALGLTPAASPIVTCGQVTRPENRRLLEELRITVRQISSRQLRALRPLVLVDVQPPYFGEALGEVAAVIDHHPPTADFRARHRDVRTSYGASATIAGEYALAAADGALTGDLATALLYGIITDTKSLSRPTSPADLEMFAFLFPRADHAALRRIQHPSYAPAAMRRFGRALERARVSDGLAYVHLGRLPAGQEHIVAQLAEFCLGMENAEVSAVSGVFGRRLVMSTRALRPDARLGDALRARFGAYGSAGGHPVMAKAVIRLTTWRRDHPSADDGALARSVRAALREALGKGRGK
jgi:nanoRNase/pAp phosphatase (c-di-AMP/oligoRNAs hydrolase)